MLGIDEAETIVTEYMKYQNYSITSIESIIGTLKRFRKYLKEEKRPKDLREIKEKDLYDFIEYSKRISKRGLGKTGQNDYIGHMKKVFKILTEEEKILINPFQDVPYIRNPQSIRDKILTEEEIRELLASIDESQFTGIRNKVVLSILYGSGLRSRELMNLEVEDFIKDEKLLLVRQGKGRKDRLVPLGKSLFNLLLYYVEKTRPRLVRKKKVKYLLTNVKGGKMTQDCLKSIIREVKKNTGFKKKLHPHMLRHTFATHLLNNGADIREVQLLLGHASLKATEIYLNLTTNHLKEVYTKYHPLENELYFDVYGREGYILNEGFAAGIKLLDKKTLTKT